MKKEWLYTQGRYRPLLDKSDKHVETIDQYYARINPLLPNFPKEVLEQWFYRHWSQIDDYAWLEYDSWQFEQVSWTAEQVINSGIKENSTIGVDFRHFQEGVRYPRQLSIVEYFESNGTWPVAPIFFENISGEISRPDGYKLTAPYHLIEGHHRAAIFRVFYDRKALNDKHQVWVIR